MYTGTLINDLLGLVERAERFAKAADETKLFSGESEWQEDVMQQAATNHGARNLTDQTVPEAAWSEHG